jgi:hypothetical protein
MSDEDIVPLWIEEAVTPLAIKYQLNLWQRRFVSFCFLGELSKGRSDTALKGLFRWMSNLLKGSVDGTYNCWSEENLSELALALFDTYKVLEHSKPCDTKENPL